MKYFNVDAEKLYQCTGCGTVTKDPGKHQELIQKAGGLACCPDNSYIECMPPLQPPIMFARKHDIETFERSMMRPDNCGLIFTVQNVADQHYSEPLFIHEDPRWRTPKDYAIEHAGYLETTLLNFLNYLNEISDEEEGTLVPDDRFGDHMQAVRSHLYEFQKRRDLALGISVEQKAAA